MIRTARLQHVFVEFIPESLDPGKLYISLEFATASHQCCCGCGREVVTPLSPNDWQMTFDGESISLSPSIGNWKFRCQSHYFVRRGQIIEAPSWDKTHKSQERDDDLTTDDANTPVGWLQSFWRKLFVKNLKPTTTEPRK